MIRARRIAFPILLVLMQILAPWVHAHTGVETGGFLHIPGLEFLAGTAAGYARAGSRPGGPDLIVGVQAGKWDQDDAFRPAPQDREPPALLPAAIVLPSPALFVIPAAATEPPPLFSAACRHDGNPRAPPPNSAFT